MLSISALRASSIIGLPLDQAFSFEENRRPRAARVSPLTSRQMKILWQCMVIVGCGIAQIACSVPATIFRPPEPISVHIGRVLEPVVLVGVAAGAFWQKENRWPSSLDDIASMAPHDRDWQTLVAKLSGVTFKPQPDGSIMLEGMVTPTGPSVKYEPARFVATVKMKRDSTVASGWRAEVKADLAEEPNTVGRDNALHGPAISTIGIPLDGALSLKKPGDRSSRVSRL